MWPVSYRVTVSYEEVSRALSVLVGLRLRGSIQGPPLSKLPLRRIVENAMREHIIGTEEYRDIVVMGVDAGGGLHLVCHFNRGDNPDDFCVALEGDNPWKRVLDAAAKLSKATNASYTELLSGIVHALQGIVSGHEEEVEEITSSDEVLEEFLTWLPEYISVVD